MKIYTKQEWDAIINPVIQNKNTSDFETACSYFRQICQEIGQEIYEDEFRGGYDDMINFYNHSSYKTDRGLQLAVAWAGCNDLCKHEAEKIGLTSPQWWYKCWQNVPKTDLVTLGILTKPISEYTIDDIGTTIRIPYIDQSYKATNSIRNITLDAMNKYLDFEIVAINHHKDINNPNKPTLTLMCKHRVAMGAFDMSEKSEGSTSRSKYGNNRWAVSNVRQWLNSDKPYGGWFEPQHEYDNPPYDGFDYDIYQGFLYGFSTEVKKHLAKISNKTVLCNYDRDILGKDYEITEDYAFLPSRTEIGYGNVDDNCPQGVHLSNKFNSDLARKNNFTVYDTGYWLRTPYLTVESTNYVVNVRSMGIEATEYSCSTEDIIPFIVLK